MERLFVYGTLKWEMIDSVMPQVVPYLNYETNGYVAGKLFDVDHYPGAVPASSVRYKIFGQLLSVKTGFERYIFQTLDEYEGCDETNVANSLFRREKTKVYINNIDSLEAWIYWYNRPVSRLTEITGGIYSKE